MRKSYGMSFVISIGALLYIIRQWRVYKENCSAYFTVVSLYWFLPLVNIVCLYLVVFSRPRDSPHTAFRVRNWMHLSDVKMGTMAYQIIGALTVCSAVYSVAYKKNHQSSCTGLCEGHPLVIGGLPSQRSSNPDMFPVDVVLMVIIILDYRPHADIPFPLIYFIYWLIIKSQGNPFVLVGEFPVTYLW